MGVHKAAAIAQQNKDDFVAAIKVITKDTPKLCSGQVLVHVTHRPINPSDIFCLQGLYGGFKPPSFPAVCGLEGVGVVEELGPGSSNFKVGQRVVAVPWPSAAGEGTWQELTAVEEGALVGQNPDVCLEVAVPDEVSNEAAAQYMVNPVTAWGFLEETAVPDGEFLLQNAANSVLGQELISLAQYRGVQLINLVRRREVVKDLEAVGAQNIIVTTEEDIVQRVQDITEGRGAWACINPIGGEPSRDIFKCVRQSGTVYIFSMFGESVLVPMDDLHFRDITVRGFWLNAWLHSLPNDGARRLAVNTVMDLMAKGVISPPPPAATFPLEEAQKAVEFSKGKSGGKVIMTS